MPLHLSSDFRKVRGRWLCDEIDRAVRDRADLDSKLELVRSLYWSDKAPGAVPWEGASDIHLPVMYEKIELAVPKIINAFWGTEPIVHVKRVPSEFMPEETDAAERLLNWGIEQDIYPNFYGTSENWFRNTLRDGTASVKIYWRRDWEKTVEVHRRKLGYSPGDMSIVGVLVEEPRAKTAQDLLFETFGIGSIKHGLIDYEELDREEYTPTNTDADDLIGRAFSVEFIEDRRRLTGTAVIRASEYVDEIDIYVYRRILRHDRPCVEVVEHEDLILPYRAASIQDAPWVAQQYWMTKREIKAKYDSGELSLSPEQFDQLMSVSGSRQREMEENDDLKDQKDRVVGEGSNDQSFSVGKDEQGQPDLFTDNTQLLFFEVYMLDDVDGDGDPIEVIYHVSHDLSCVVGCDYLSEMFAHNRRPYATLKYKEMSSRFYAQGMGEVLVAINLEVNTIVNYINNNQELINNPFYFYVPAATMVDPGVLHGISPGDGVPIGDINGVMFPKFNQQPLANLSAMDTLLLFADRITISPMVGGSPQIRNAPRTARGTMSLLSEGNIQLDNIITRWQRTGWNELMHQVMSLYQDYLPDEKYIQVTGTDGSLVPEVVTPAQIRGRYMFKFTGNTVNTNREILRSIAQVRYNTIMTHPDYSQDPQVRREALKDFLRHMSEGVDIERLIPAMPGQGGYQHPPMPQSSENQSMLHGLPVDALPTDDHAAHLQELERFSRSQAFDTMPQDRVILFAMHQKQHMQYMQQQQRQGMQPVSPGMGNNVPTGMSQNGGTDMDALEGGVQ